VEQQLLTILRFAEVLACVLGFVYWKKVKGSYWKAFPFYLLFIVFSEAFGHYTKVHNEILLNKYYFLVLEIPSEFLFFYYIFFKAFKTRSYRWLPVVCTCIYILSWFTDMFFLGSHVFWFYSFSDTMGNLLLLVLILRYFLQLLSGDEILGFKNDMLFWVCIGLLLYHLGTFPLYGLKNVLYIRFKNIYNVYKYLENILDSLMYFLFAFSFIWGKPKS